MGFVALDQSASPEQQRGFVPLAEKQEAGFVPLDQGGAGSNFSERIAPAVKTVRAIGQVYPVAETVANLITQGAALPAAGLAGLGAAAAKAAGLTDAEPADVVHSVSGALTFQPISESGKHLTQAAMTPFEWLAKGGTAAGDKVLDATGSPVAATAVDTAINALPMAIGPLKKKGAQSVRERIAGKAEAEPVIAAPVAEPARGFVSLETTENARRLAPAAPEATNATPTMPEPSPGLSVAPEASVRGLPPGQAQMIAGRMTRDGVPMETYPHPSGDGTFAVRPIDAIRSPDTMHEVIHGKTDAQPEAPGNVSGADGTVSPLPRGGDYGLPGMANEFRTVPEGRRAETQPRALAAEEGQARGLQPMERRLGTAGEESPGLNIDPAAGPMSAAVHAGVRSGAIVRPAVPETLNAAAPAHNALAPGNAYTGLVSDVPQAKTATAPATAVGRDAPLRREDILIQFAKDLGSSFYEGRVKGKEVMGFFKPKTEETRIKRHADIEVAAHEMAHLIDARVPAIANAWRTNLPLREQLRSISYDQAKVNEGFAEGVRLWMTQPDVLQAKAPLVFDWLENFTTTDTRYGSAMKKAQHGMLQWFGQDAIDRARSKIGDHAPLSDALNGLFDRFRQSTVDDLHGVYRFERELSGGKLAPVGAYETARLSRASASIADGAIRFGYPVKNTDGSFTYRGKGLREIMAPAAERLDDALLYFVGRSARELMQQEREHLFTPGEIRGMLALETPEFRKAFAEYQVWNRKVLDFAEAQGVLNPQTRLLWKRTEYLPFHRVSQPGGLKGKPGDWAGIQQLTGGTENIKDVLGNMIGNAAMLIDKAVKNEARLKVAQLAARPGGGRFMAMIEPGSRPVKISGDQVLDAMLKKFGIGVVGDAPAFFEFMINGQPPAGGNVVAVLKAGKPVWYEVADPILYRALSALDRPPVDWLTKWIGLPKRLGQATVTLTPDFMLANIARDTLMGAVMSRSGFRPVIDSLQGMRLRMTEDPIYRDYIANGGGLSSLYLDEHHLRTKLEKFYTRQGIDFRTVLDTPDKILSFVETLGEAFEMSTRLGEYGRAIAKGEHPRHAAYQGREVSTDFAMRGDSKALGFLYDTVMFLRPAVVSMDRLFRGIAHDPNKAAIGMKTAMIALSSVGLYLLNRDDPRYADLPDWDRDSNWHFFVGDQHFRYPKIWEIGAVASVAERTVEKLMQSDPQGLGKDFVRIIANTFNLNFMPQVLAPLAQQATNRNSFTGAPLETPGMEDMQPFLRAKPNTSETMKALGMATRDLPESLQLNPVRAEALLRGYLNTWGVYGLMLSDRALFGDQLPDMRADQMPVVRRFYSQEPPQHTKFEAQFYDMLGEAKRLNGTLRELDRLGRPEIADEKEKSPLTGESKPLARAARNVQQVNAEMLHVHRDKTMAPDAKRERLDALIVEKNALLKASVHDAEAAQRGKR